jgi:hypothetical protein
MPTPIQHLRIADEIMSIQLPFRSWQLLTDHRPAFLLGSCAPDVTILSGQSREQTHFVNLSMRNQLSGYQEMFRIYSELACPDKLDGAQAAFITGYITHLLVDELWVAQVYDPYLATQVPKNQGNRSALVEDLLRAWLENRDLVKLNANVGNSLAWAEPDRWVSFISDEHLGAWRDRIVKSFSTAMRTRTAEIFAARHHLSVSEFRRILSSPSEMKQRIFSRVPLQGLEQFYIYAFERGRALAVSYLSSDLCAKPE